MLLQPHNGRHFSYFTSIYGRVYDAYTFSFLVYPKAACNGSADINLNDDRRKIPNLK